MSIQNKAAALAKTWFDQLTLHFNTNPSPTGWTPEEQADADRAANQPLKPPMPVPSFPTFKVLTTEEIQGVARHPNLKGLFEKNLLHSILHASASEEFFIITGVIQEKAGDLTVENPCLYVVETMSRTRGSGWGPFQPYGKSLPPARPGGERRVPDINPSKVSANIWKRMLQIRRSDTPPPPTTKAELLDRAPDGVFLYDDPQARHVAFLLHIASKRVTREQAEAVVSIFTPKNLTREQVDAIEAIIQSPPSPRGNES